MSRMDRYEHFVILFKFTDAMTVNINRLIWCTIFRNCFRIR